MADPRQSGGSGGAGWRGVIALVIGSGVWIYRTWEGASIGVLDAMLIAGCLFGGGAGVLEALTRYFSGSGPGKGGA